MVLTARTSRTKDSGATSSRKAEPADRKAALAIEAIITSVAATRSHATAAAWTSAAAKAAIARNRTQSLRSPARASLLITLVSPSSTMAVSQSTGTAVKIAARATAIPDHVIHEEVAVAVAVAPLPL